MIIFNIYMVVFIPYFNRTEEKKTVNVERSWKMVQQELY